MLNYSVLMSVYAVDNPQYFQTAVESMLAQTAPPEQIVIVVDGPVSEATQAVLEQYESRMQLFTIVRQKQNTGLGQALNHGLSYCRNELVARMDADDISLPMRCEKELALFEKEPELAIVGCNIDEFYDEPSHVVSSRIVPTEPEEIKRRSGRIQPFNHPTVIYKKSEVIRCGGYGTFRRKQDRDLFSRMVNMDCKARNIDESLLLFRSNKDNYKRRKSWTYCRSTIEVSFKIWKRGHCSLGDLLYVCSGQMLMFILPLPLMKAVSDSMLRVKR